MYNLAICFTYFIEMLISYSFFSLVGDKKLKSHICIIIGTALFLSGALFDILFSNIVWLNTVYFLFIIYYSVQYVIKSNSHEFYFIQ